MEHTEAMIDATRATAALATVLKSQYHAALAMLREAVERCPDELWLDQRPKNAFWQVAYHALFFAHLYAGSDEASFRPWAGHQAETHWYKVSKLEHQIINIRHIQHHTAQLMDRLRASADIGIRWVGSRRPPRPTDGMTIRARDPWTTAR